MNLTRREIHAAVRNYMANDLGLNRTEIESILREQIERRNPEELVRQAVSKYFRCGPDYFQATALANQAIQAAIEKQVQTALKNGAAQHINLMVQNFTESLYKKTQETSNTTIKTGKPGVAKIENAVFITKAKMTKTIENLLNCWFPNGHQIWIQFGDPDGTAVMLNNINSDTHSPLYNNLRKYSDNGQLSMYGPTYHIPDGVLRNIISQHICGFQVEKLIANVNGFICIGRCELIIAQDGDNA